MKGYERQYLDHLEALIEAEPKGDRTGTGTHSIFGHQMRIDLRSGFPLLTTKELHLKSIIHELLWFLNGDTNVKYLNDNGVRIWNEWADKNGDLGPVYGKQWRAWHNPYETTRTVFSARAEDDWEEPVVEDDPIDQMSEVLRLLEQDPDSRRIIVSAWNVGQIEEMALAPCHTMFQFNTQEMSVEAREEILFGSSDNDEWDGYQYDKQQSEETPVHEILDEWCVPRRYLDLQLYQRSADWFLGVPFNVASYSLLLMMVAQQVNMEPRHFIHSFGDTHLYSNHFEQAQEQIIRSIRPRSTMQINKADDLFSYKFEDFVLRGYKPAPSIKAPVAV